MSNLTNRYHRCKIEDSLNDWERIMAGGPLRSILGPLLFNIFKNDIFLCIETQTYVIMHMIVPFMILGIFIYNYRKP